MPFSEAEDPLPPPLVVALFGGTGVGKSTLLNRLAGSEIAEASPLRPTSRQLTVYLHRRLDPLPLPGGVRVVRHDQERLSQIVWIDTPDLDSVESEHRQQALAILPLVDVVVYVVDPERYRDDTGWRLLLEERQRHGWLFVMSHWDSGHELQIEDLKGLLREAGFEDPILLRCDNRPEVDRRRPDDFATLEAILEEVAAVKGQDVIRKRRGEMERGTLAMALEKLSFAPPERWVELQERWRKVVADRRRDLLPLIEEFSQTASRFRAQEERWFLEPLQLALDQLLLEAADLGLPHRALALRLDPLRRELAATIDRTVRQAIVEALRRPGGRLHTLATVTSEKLRFGLPLLASSGIAYQVVVKYYQGFFEEKYYLGDEFLLHSAMLLLLSWLIPELLYRLLRPPTEKRRQAGIALGLERALAELEGRVAALIGQLAEEAERKEAERRDWLARLETRPEPLPPLPYLERMLPRHARAA